jgi:hypothetical protein
MTPQTPKSSDSDLKLKPSKKAAVPEAESSHRYLWEETESASLSSGIPVPATHTLYQQLHNYPVGDSGKECASLTKGCEDNIQPIRRAVEHLERTRQPRGGTPRAIPTRRSPRSRARNGRRRSRITETPIPSLAFTRRWPAPASSLHPPGTGTVKVDAGEFLGFANKCLPPDQSPHQEIRKVNPRPVWCL